MFGPTDPAAVALQQAAEARGFVVAWAPADLPSFAVNRYRAWIADKRQAGMGQLARNIEVRLTPSSRLAWARSALVLAAPYGFPDPGPPPVVSASVAWVASSGCGNRTIFSGGCSLIWTS